MYFLVAIVAYVIAAASEVFFVQILGSVVDLFSARGGEKPPVPDRTGWLPDLFIRFEFTPTLLFSTMIGVAALARALGTVVGEYLLSQVSFHVRSRCPLRTARSALGIAKFVFRHSTGR